MCNAFYGRANENNNIEYVPFFATPNFTLFAMFMQVAWISYYNFVFLVAFQHCFGEKELYFEVWHKHSTTSSKECFAYLYMFLFIFFDLVWIRFSFVILEANESTWFCMITLTVALRNTMRHIGCLTTSLHETTVTYLMQTTQMRSCSLMPPMHSTPWIELLLFTIPEFCARLWRPMQ